MLYATVPIAFALLKRYAKPVVLLGIFAFSITYKEIFACLYQQSGNAYAILERQVGSQLIYFYAGTAVLLYFEHLMRYAKPLLLTEWPFICSTTACRVTTIFRPSYLRCCSF